MSTHKVTVCCWNCCSTFDFGMSKKQEESLFQKIKKGKAVCPSCRDSGKGNMPVFIKEGKSLFDAPKVYKCNRNHAVCVSVLSSGYIQLTYGPNSDNFVNIEGTLSELSEMIQSLEITCPHDGEKLEPIDDCTISYPSVHNIKTKTRVGDLWDKNGISPVRPGHYTEDGYEHTRSELANRERLKKIRERNIAAGQTPGKRIDKPTDRVYNRRSNP